MYVVRLITFICVFCHFIIMTDAILVCFLMTGLVCVFMSIVYVVCCDLFRENSKVRLFLLLLE